MQNIDPKPKMVNTVHCEHAYMAPAMKLQSYLQRTPP